VSVAIREARPEDAAIIVEMIRELARGEGDETAVTEAHAAAYLGVPGNGILLAERDGSTLGLISYSIRPNLYHAADSCLIEELIVRRQARGAGVGRRLVEELMRRCIDMGCAEISVSTMPDNERAIRFYRKMGFTDEALFLEKHLET
jgi:ribosomal protein S18 acetylase RimI-like enzyme